MKLSVKDVYQILDNFLLHFMCERQTLSWRASHFLFCTGEEPRPWPSAVKAITHFSSLLYAFLSQYVIEKGREQCVMRPNRFFSRQELMQLDGLVREGLLRFSDRHPAVIKQQLLLPLVARLFRLAGCDEEAVRTRVAKLAIKPFPHYPPFDDYFNAFGREPCPGNYLYRGDSRGPEVIFEKGFQATYPSLSNFCTLLWCAGPKQVFWLLFIFLLGQEIFPLVLLYNWTIGGISCAALPNSAAQFPLNLDPPGLFSRPWTVDWEKTWSDTSYVYELDPSKGGWLDVTQVSGSPGEAASDAREQPVANDAVGVNEWLPLKNSIPFSSIRRVFVVRRTWGCKRDFTDDGGFSPDFFLKHLEVVEVISNARFQASTSNLRSAADKMGWKPGVECKLNGVLSLKNILPDYYKQLLEVDLSQPIIQTRLSPRR